MPITIWAMMAMSIQQRCPVFFLAKKDTYLKAYKVMGKELRSHPTT
jgi:hypothetical protein